MIPDGLQDTNRLQLQYYKQISTLLSITYYQILVATIIIPNHMLLTTDEAAWYIISKGLCLSGSVFLSVCINICQTITLASPDV